MIHLVVRRRVAWVAVIVLLLSSVQLLAPVVVSAHFLFLDPTSGPLGQIVSVDGPGWPVDHEVQLQWQETTGRRNLGNALTDSNGAFETTFKVPPGTVGGDHNVIAVDATDGGCGDLSQICLSGYSVTEVFTVTNAPPPPAPPRQPASLTLSDDTGSLKVNATVHFLGWALDAQGNGIPDVPVKIHVTGANQQDYSTYSAGEGNFNFNYVGTNAGTDTVTATGSGLTSPTLTVTWTGSGTSTPTPPPPSSPSSKLIYIALGDSIASGHGLLDDNSACRRSKPNESTHGAYPFTVAQILDQQGYSIQFPDSNFIACTGATVFVAHSADDTPDRWMRNQIDAANQIIVAAKGQPVLVSITAGADDFQFADEDNFIKRLYDDNDQDFNTWASDTATGVHDVLLAQLKELAQYPNVSVVVTGVYNPFNSQSVFFKGLSPGNCGPDLLHLVLQTRACFDRTEEGTDLLNRALQNAVADATNDVDLPGQVFFANIRDEFRDHSAPSPDCGNAGPQIGDSWIQRKFDPHSNSDPQLDPTWGPPGTWIGDCVHPNDMGAEKIAEAVASTFLQKGEALPPIELAAIQAAPDDSSTGCTFYQQTQHNLCGGFKAYWNQYGGLAVFGYPISEEFQENGATVQYFERARFEWRPGSWPERYDVQLGLLGTQLATNRSLDPSFQPAAEIDGNGCIYFQQTQHNLCGGFLAYWEKYGGEAVYGMPLSEEFQEVNADTGQIYTVQYFERQRFEWHPGEAPDRYDVLLGRLGAQALGMN